MTDPRGYVAPSFEEIRLDVVAKWKRTFGPNSDTASDTIDGLIIDLLTWFLTIAYEGLEQVDQNHFFNTATGLNLDAILVLFGTERNPPTGSSAPVFLYGADTTVVPSLSQMTTIDAGDTFELNDPVTIASGIHAVFTVGPSSTAATVTISIGLEDSFVSFIGAASAEELRDGLVSALGSNLNVELATSGGLEPGGDGIIYVEMVNPLSTAIISSSGSPVGAFDASEGVATSVVTGPIPASRETLTRIGSPLTGWQGVTNIVDAGLGADEETDPKLRTRHILEVHGLGRATIRALRADLNNQKFVPGVEEARVYMNTMGSVDPVSGRPSHSFESVVLGGSGPDIATTIYRHHTTGTQSYGTNSEIVVDNREDPPASREIFYSRATEMFIWADITITKGEGFPTTATADIRADISNAVTEFGKTLRMGRDVYIVELSGETTTTTPGISSVVIRLGITGNPTDPKPPLSGSDIIVGEKSISRWDPSRIDVSIV